MSKDQPLLSNCPLETAEPSRNYARVPGYKKKYKKKTRKRREKKRKMNGVEINTRAYVATRLLLRWDYLYAVTLKTKVFGDYNHARLEVSWITSTRGLLLRGYTGRNGHNRHFEGLSLVSSVCRSLCTGKIELYVSWAAYFRGVLPWLQRTAVKPVGFACTGAISRVIVKVTSSSDLEKIRVGLRSKSKRRQAGRFQRRGLLRTLGKLHSKIISSDMKDFFP